MWKIFQSKEQKNCGVTVGTLTQMGVRIQRMVRNMICPYCKNKIEKAEYEYFDKSIWHKSCLKIVRIGK